MKLIAPNYYKKFKCIADKCRHSCCIGWEIDIDDGTFDRYKAVQGDFGKKLKDGIEFADGIACFKLDGDERCPFLNKNNLCDIILNLGEDFLCQICNDHPRFRNFYSGATEIGIGLCCESAAEIIIRQKGKVTLEVIAGKNENDEYSVEEASFIEFRNKLFDILQNRCIAVNQRTEEFLISCNGKCIDDSLNETVNFLLSLERLDSKWTEILNEIKDMQDFTSVQLPSYFNTVAEQLLVYFTYRHLSGYLDDGRLSQRSCLIVFSYKIIEMLCKYHMKKHGEITYSCIAEYARLYSSEIEYSEENIEAILEKF